MNDEQLYRMQGIYSQLISVQQDFVQVMVYKRYPQNRRRDLVRRLEHIVEQLNDEDLLDAA